MRLTQRQLIKAFTEGKTSGKTRIQMEIDGDVLYSWGNPIVRRYNGRYLVSTMYNGGSLHYQMRPSRHIMAFLYSVGFNHIHHKVIYVQGWADEDCHTRIIKNSYFPHFTSEWGICRAFYKWHWAIGEWKGCFWDGTKQVIDIEVKGVNPTKSVGDNAILMKDGKCAALRVKTSPCFFNKTMNQNDCTKCPSRFQCFTEKDFGAGFHFFIVKGTNLTDILRRHFLNQASHKYKYGCFRDMPSPTYTEVTKEEASILKQAIKKLRHED